jgi:hypothetical protein
VEVSRWAAVIVALCLFLAVSSRGSTSTVTDLPWAGM